MFVRGDYKTSSRQLDNVVKSFTIENVNVIKALL